MSLFYFHLRTGNGLDPDDIGLDLDSAEAAYLEACAAIPDLSREALQQGCNPCEYAFEIRDSTGQLHWDVPFVEDFGFTGPRRQAADNRNG